MHIQIDTDEHASRTRLAWQREENAEVVWTEGGLTYTEVICQCYTNCAFSAGGVAGHPVDTLYLCAERDDGDRTLLLLRPDEAAALAWCLSGVLWSDAIRTLTEKGETPDDNYPV